MASPSGSVHPRCELVIRSQETTPWVPPREPRRCGIPLYPPGCRHFQVMALHTLPVAQSVRPQIRVAVVDDNPGFRETLASLLGTEELIVVGAAGSGADAVGLVRSTEPDVVLMDVRMPQMNGIEATRLLKMAFPDVGIVALTGVDDQDAV